ncbi:MAG: hypothetical protein FJ087_18400, partial [Deltaproteobacteria bacterium]|nr:hypothetical protein [Deltaproteobacteria bacterium]
GTLWSLANRISAADFGAAYWTGRMQGTITLGAGTALGWRPLGGSCTP